MHDPAVLQGPAPEAVLYADLYKAVSVGDLQQLQPLLTTTAVAQRRYEFKRTILHHAVGYGNPDVIALLLSCGAAVHAADSCGQTALHLAAGAGFEPVVQQLLQHKADVTAADHKGDTPLHSAAAAGHSPVVALLLLAKASVHTGNSSGARPLHKAASNGHSAVVSQLLAAGATASVPDAEGLSPLHRAAAAGHAAVVKAILQKQPLPSPELQVAVCFADIFGHIPVLAQLLLQLNRQDNKAAAVVLPQVAQEGPRSIQLQLAMLQAWRADTAEVTTAAGAVARQHQKQAKVKAGLQHLIVGIAAEKACRQQEPQQQEQDEQHVPHAQQEQQHCRGVVSEEDSEHSACSVEQAVAC